MVKVMLFFAIVAFGLLVVAVIALGKRHREFRREKLYPQGHWMGLGMSLGMCSGIPLGFVMGLAMGNTVVGIIFGPAIGVSIGCALGAILEARHKDHIRPLTQSEQKRRKLAVAAGLVFLIMGVIFFSRIFFLR